MERGTPPEATAAIVAGELAAAIQSGTCVDEHMQDQVSWRVRWNAVVGLCFGLPSKCLADRGQHVCQVSSGKRALTLAAADKNC